MKTARSIEEQEERKKAEKDTVSCAHNSAPVSGKRDRRKDAERLKPYCFKPGQSGNPGGRPRVDLAAEIAKALFENDGPAIYAAFQRVLRRGSPYAYQILADRAYGKLKERREVEVTRYTEASDQTIIERIAELEAKLGYREPHSTPELLPPGDKPKINQTQ